MLVGQKKDSVEKLVQSWLFEIDLQFDLILILEKLDVCLGKVPERTIFYCFKLIEAVLYEFVNRLSNSMVGKFLWYVTYRMWFTKINVYSYVMVPNESNSNDKILLDC